MFVCHREKMEIFFFFSSFWGESKKKKIIMVAMIDLKRE